MIRPAVAADVPAIAAIYNHYVRHTTVTFEEEPVTDEEMAGRVAAVQQQFPWLVYEQNSAILGYAYGGPWKARSAYRETVEISVYLHHKATGNGLGKQLYRALLDELRALKTVHSVIGGVALPNEASVRLHEGFGFTYVGAFRENGIKFGKRVDVGYWQLVLE